MRVKLWTAGLRMIEDRPIVGVGPGNFVTASPRYSRGEMLRFQLGPHNSYVGIAAENGLVGLGLFLLLHFLTLRTVAHAVRFAQAHSLSEVRALGLGVEVCLIVLMTAGLSIGIYYSKYLWLFLGLAASTRGMFQEEESARAPSLSNEVHLQA